MIRSSQPFPPDCFAASNPFLAMVSALPPDAFTELPTFGALADGAAVEQDSRRWAARLFRGPASPYRAEPRVKRTAHHATPSTVDLVRHELRVGELALQITESVRFVLARVEVAEPLPLGGDDRAAAAAIELLAEQLLVTSGSYQDVFGQPAKYQWTLAYVPPIGEGSRFTTAPRVEPATMQSYAERLDSGILGGDPFFLGFKTRASGDGRRLFLDAQHWFDGQCWAPYERSPRR